MLCQIPDDSRHRCCRREEKEVKCEALITLNEPYNFVTVSDDLCHLLDFAAEQMRGRSIKMIQGPSTNTVRFGVAIKMARLHHKSTISLTAYCRNGSELSFLVSCAPQLGDEDKAEGVVLTFVPVSESTQLLSRTAHPHPLDDLTEGANRAATIHLPEHDAPESSGLVPHHFLARRRLDESSRALHNHAVGRELHSEHRSPSHAAAGRRAGPRDEEALFATLLMSI